MMRMILIDHARENQIKMRGGHCSNVPLSEDLLWVKIDSPELLDLNRALEELGALDADKIKLVELRYFLGCTAEETAEVMQVSKATVDREMKFIKGWLFQRIHPDHVQVRPRFDAFRLLFRNVVMVKNSRRSCLFSHEQLTERILRVEAISQRPWTHRRSFAARADWSSMRGGLHLADEVRLLLERLGTGKQNGWRPCRRAPGQPSCPAGAEDELVRMRLIACWDAAAWAPSIWRIAPTDSSSRRSPSN